MIGEVLHEGIQLHEDVVSMLLKVSLVFFFYIAISYVIFSLVVVI